MNVLPFMLSTIFGWMMGHLFVLMERKSSWLRLLNYPIGIAGAAIGTATSQNVPSLYNKFFVIGILSSGITLLLYQSLRRLFASRRSFEPSV